MMKNKLKSIVVGFGGDEEVVFHPRAISLAEQEDVSMKFSDISDSDDEKSQKEFDLCKQAVAEWSEKIPQKLIREKGEVKFVDLVENPESSLDAIERYFGERTNENERVIREAYFLILGQQKPNSRFL